MGGYTLADLGRRDLLCGLAEDAPCQRPPSSVSLTRRPLGRGTAGMPYPGPHWVSGRVKGSAHWPDPKGQKGSGSGVRVLAKTPDPKGTLTEMLRAFWVSQ